jgi:hypothetical protein
MAKLSGKVDSLYEIASLTRAGELVATMGYTVVSMFENRTVDGHEFNLVAKLFNKNRGKLPITPDKKQRTGRFPKQFVSEKHATTLLIGECTTGQQYDYKFKQLAKRVTCARDHYDSEKIDVVVLFFGQALKGCTLEQLNNFTKQNVNGHENLKNLFEAGKVKAYY